MLTRLRRFVLLVTFAAWQGGFVFYAGVVVPVGTEFHGHFGQGLVTQRVTYALNMLGLACHIVYFWELMVARESRRWNWLLWGVSLAMLNALAWLHLKMDWLIDVDGRQTADSFRGWHIVYLWLSTGQWVIVGVLAWANVTVGRETKGNALGPTHTPSSRN